MNVIEEIEQSKINKLMQEVPKGLVLLSTWLRSEGYSYELQQRYRLQRLAEIHRDRGYA
jgi:hypothetical protein